MPRFIAQRAALALVACVLLAPAAPAQDSLTGNRTDHRDGSSSITVNRRLPTQWDASVGADIALTAPASLERRDRPLVDPNETSSGVAWARATVPGDTVGLWDKTTLEARIDPRNEESRVGTRFSRSVPVGSDLSVTFENGYAMTRPLHDHAAPETPSTHWETERTLRLNVAPADATLSVSSRKSSADGHWLNALSAEKRLFGPLTVTGRLSETPEGAVDRSITAGFRKTW